MGAASRRLEGRTSAMMQRNRQPGKGPGGDSIPRLGRVTKMAKMTDRIRKALGMKVRIAGAAYTDEWWGDIPPADPHAVMDGVQLAYVGTDAVRTPTHGIPALFANLEEIEEDEEDWEAKLREAK